MSIVDTIDFESFVMSHEALQAWLCFLVELNYWSFSLGIDFLPLAGAYSLASFEPAYKQAGITWNVLDAIYCIISGSADLALFIVVKHFKKQHEQQFFYAGIIQIANGTQLASLSICDYSSFGGLSFTACFGICLLIEAIKLILKLLNKEKRSDLTVGLIANEPDNKVRDKLKTFYPVFNLTLAFLGMFLKSWPASLRCGLAFQAMTSIIYLMRHVQVASSMAIQLAPQALPDCRNDYEHGCFNHG